MDASSAIILYRSNLHARLMETYSIVLPRSVYREITVDGRAGAGEYMRLVREGQVSVQDTPSSPGVPGLERLDQGERDVILLYLAGSGQFLITDDGRAARFCRSSGIPFINGLLFPRVLKMAGLMDSDACRQAMLAVRQAGRYSGDIVSFVETCGKEHIAFALP